jgi:hypothetical protein
MIVIAGLVLGAAFGWFRASRREGNSFDKWQYALVHAILFALLGLFLTIALERLFV